jgi:hypothetical protein
MKNIRVPGLEKEVDESIMTLLLSHDPEMRLLGFINLCKIAENVKIIKETSRKVHLDNSFVIELKPRRHYIKFPFIPNKPGAAAGLYYFTLEDGNRVYLSRDIHIAHSESLKWRIEEGIPDKDVKNL